MRRLESDVKAACEALVSAEVLEVLEGLRVLKAASLDASCREFIIRSGGFAAVLTCFIGIKPSPQNWLLLEVLETAATTLLLLLCKTRRNTSVCEAKRYSTWWKQQRAKELKNASPDSSTATATTVTSASASILSAGDTCWYNEYAGRILHKTCGARLLMSVLKSFPNRERLVHALSWLLLAVGEIEGKTGQVARTDGGISLILDVLWTPVTMADGLQVARSPLSLQAVLLLLCLFTRTSESNVFAVSKAGGFSVLCKFAAQWRTMPLVSEAAFTVLANCTRLEKISAVCTRASAVVSVAFEALQTNAPPEPAADAILDVDGAKARNGMPPQILGINFETTEVVLQLVSNLSTVTPNVAAMLSSLGKEQMYGLLKMSSLPSHLRIICCTIMWKLLAHSASKSKNAKHFDLNRTKKWERPKAKFAASTSRNTSCSDGGKESNDINLSFQLLEGIQDVSLAGDAEADKGDTCTGTISNSNKNKKYSVPSGSFGFVPSLAEQCG